MQRVWQSAYKLIYGPLAFPAALLAVAAVVVFLFAYPLVSAALGFALPFVFIGSVGAVALLMNLRWTLWHGRRPLFFAVADMGFLVCLASFAVYGFASIADSWAALPYVLIGIVMLALARIAFIEFEAWLIGMLAAPLMLLVFGAYIRFTILEPAWFFDFTASLLLVAGVVLVFAGSTGALIESLRGSAREQSPRWSKAGLAACAVLLAFTIGTSAILTAANRETPASAAGAYVISIDGGRFEPLRLSMRPGEARLLVKNTGLLVHTFTIDDLGVDVVLGPGTYGIVEFSAAVGESYGFRCRVPGQTMSGVITVP